MALVGFSGLLAFWLWYRTTRMDYAKSFSLMLDLDIFSRFSTLTLSTAIYHLFPFVFSPSCLHFLRLVVDNATSLLPGYVNFCPVFCVLCSVLCCATQCNESCHKQQTAIFRQLTTSNNNNQRTTRDVATCSDCVAATNLPTQNFLSCQFCQQ